jgi:hypothetical protein
VGFKIVLSLVGIVSACFAVIGLIQGKIYCKGGPFVRATQPVAFWASVVVYFLWTALMGYFVFFGQISR